ncbi:hypothetical protein [uncultured Corynebacterium sp.]|nr:hypothetical protein [uncultured Corynebacterium sp.]
MSLVGVQVHEVLICINSTFYGSMRQFSVVATWGEATAAAARVIRTL